MYSLLRFPHRSNGKFSCFFFLQKLTSRKSSFWRNTPKSWHKIFFNIFIMYWLSRITRVKFLNWKSQQKIVKMWLNPRHSFTGSAILSVVKYAYMTNCKWKKKFTHSVLIQKGIFFLWWISIFSILWIKNFWKFSIHFIFVIFFC